MQKDKIIAIAEKHGLIINSDLTEDKKIVVANLKDLVACIEEILNNSETLNDFNTEPLLPALI